MEDASSLIFSQNRRKNEALFCVLSDFFEVGRYFIPPVLALFLGVFSDSRKIHVILWKDTKITIKEEFTMRVNMNHVVEIAGGLVIGGLISDVFDGTVKLVVKGGKKVVKKIKEKKAEKEEA